MPERLRGVAAISGFADMPASREAGGRRPAEIAAGVAMAAVADAGLGKHDIDGLLCAPPFGDYSILWPGYLCEYLGLAPTYLDTVELGGASAAGMIWRAAAAISAGMCRHVLCVTADAVDLERFARVVRMLPPSDRLYEFPYGNVAANPGYALIAQRHMYEYGTTAEQLAAVVVDQRASAAANPLALYHDQPLTADDVLGARMILDPLRRPEIVTPCTHGSAVIVSRADLAADLPQRPVYLLGAGEAGAHAGVTRAPSLTHSWIADSARRAWRMAGLGPADMDFIQPYDCYSITVVITLEDLGFCAKGEGGAFAADTGLGVHGALPCNTHGGQLGCGQAGLDGGMTHVVEGVRQLMGRAGDRQVQGAEHGVVHGNGGIMSEQVTLVLGLGA